MVLLLPSTQWMYKAVSTSPRNPIPPPLSFPQVPGRGRGRLEMQVVAVMPRAGLQRGGAGRRRLCRRTASSLEPKGNCGAEDTPVCANPRPRPQPSEKKNAFTWRSSVASLPPRHPFWIPQFPRVWKGYRYLLGSFTLCFNCLPHSLISHIYSPPETSWASETFTLRALKNHSSQLFS